MTITSSDTSSNEAMNDMERAIEGVLAKGVNGLSPIERRGSEAAPPPSTPLRVEPKAGGRGDLWGPSSARVTSPMQMLAQVAEHTIRLSDDLVALACAITGEAPAPKRMRQMPVPNGGLLPAIANIAHEIEQQQCEMARLIAHVRGRL